MILTRNRANADTLKIKVSNDSVNMIHALLRNIRAERQESAKAWGVTSLAKNFGIYSHRLICHRFRSSKNSPVTLFRNLAT